MIGKCLPPRKCGTSRQGELHNSNLDIQSGEISILFLKDSIIMNDNSWY